MWTVDDASRLHSLIDQYRLEVGGVRFWAPYWVNDPKLIGAAGSAGLRGAFKGNGTELIIAESTEPADQLGGVGYDRIAIADPERGLQDQGWARGKSFHPGGPSRDGVWRLQELAG